MFFKNQRIGKYQILDTIGSGGFGSVYLAQDSWIGKKVAIKVPHKQGENMDKLLQEPRMLAELNHPNIVSVITAEQINDVFFIVMEYVEGTSLEQHLRKHKRLELEQALDWFSKIIDAICYAHRKNILHRDIRPANVLISTDGQVKLADLGTSRFLVDQHFASTRIGSPPYMAPEHFQGKATFQSDIYSFGVLMYECLTGRLPYFDKDPLRLAKIAREGAMVPPHRWNGEVPLELSQIICKSMHRSFGSRFPDATALKEALSKVHLQPALSTTLQEPERSQHLSQLIEEESAVAEAKSSTRFREVTSRELSDLFCWNCSRPVQKRSNHCPHCGVDLR
ncbi:Protein kinase [Sulfidibacter corallicola]|uniref:non-specific serine/threonine protein kinase n=1 Tax=Sulfidibacter corallicola TaxID=2818388 RepID=A0A8A4TWS8_SULCO|nr:serine/threonine-protein kinase [Sulfidibacter corallicola]QTD53940.1 protein kinase [Sulfidibacter corallicola]